MTLPVYICADIAGIACGETFTLGGAEGHHASSVRRSRAGEMFDVVDGAGFRARCEVVEAAKGSVDLKVREVFTEVEPDCPVTLVQALAKGGRDEQAVETATEYGVSHIIPWESQRCVASWRGKGAKGKARWVATVRAAAKQSRRAVHPQVADVVSTAELVDEVRQAVARGEQVFACHEEADALLSSVAVHGPTWIIVGPEGGISSEEIDQLIQAGAQSVLLAPHILRSASAGPYAIAQLHALQKENL